MTQALVLQGEMQQLRDKLSVAERTARSEAQLKVNSQLPLINSVNYLY